MTLQHLFSSLFSENRFYAKITTNNSNNDHNNNDDKNRKSIIAMIITMK